MGVLSAAAGIGRVRTTHTFIVNDQSAAVQVCQSFVVGSPVDTVHDALPTH
jgi:hypothetical protein